MQERISLGCPESRNKILPYIQIIQRFGLHQWKIN